MGNKRRLTTLVTMITLLALLALPFAAIAQTRVKPGINAFTIDDDIEFGRQKAAEIERQVPLINDPLVQQWINHLGSRLASNTGMPNLPWQFQIINSSEINAFALPGGFIFVNRGLIESTEDESEIIGALAHELAHVTLRHSTNQITKQLMLLMPLAQLANGHGRLGQIAKLGVIGMGLLFLKFSRGAERDADILGVQTMVRAGYDPRGMLAMFEKLQRGGPQFLSDHPNPENRIERIRAEIALIGGPEDVVESSHLYFQVRSRLRSMPAAPRVTPGE